jgi:hypothetical protein
MTLVWVKIWVKPSNFRFLERDRVFADSPRRTKAPWSCSAYRCNYVRPHDQICAFLSFVAILLAIAALFFRHSLLVLSPTGCLQFRV